ncbi:MULTISPECIES: DNA/RNA non-specific endonuclease [unclassified Alistipes]|uniref:DNA/RNA non-specific endonuclease n=1 Tax=unclassified Alistipes TaxID=2608932 RepID=UPI00258E2580|nr:MULTISPECIES: DNA/RNA non-specific endonuclease [unclassified Alistipes]HUN13902.1 DNA/RNA non-specific endonuclease [Alistipes sp.]
MSLFKNFHLPAWLFAGVLFLFAGCGGSDDDSLIVVRLDAETVNCNTTSNRIIAVGDAMTFVATILSQDVGDAWCSFSSFDTLIEPQFSKSGLVGVPMNLYLLRNETDQVREALIRVTFANGFSADLTLRQGAFSPTADFDRQWGEQPFFREGDTYIYKTYYTTLIRGGYVRNYSVCYDTQKRVSHWVAYPLTRNYVEPAVTRTNAWSYDPNTQLPEIPVQYQFNVANTYGTGDARGHQLPSADRYSNKETNAMTFYSTNIMPQNSDFNEGVWVDLENKIRDVRARNSRDTIFVVTGTYFAGNRYITARDGTRIGYPSNCWKVLLRGSGGKAVWDCSADELYGIGFWFANDASNTASLRSYATSIADIERKTGFAFFRNIPAGAADAVKAQNRPSDWSL